MDVRDRIIKTYQKEIEVHNSRYDYENLISRK